MEVKVLSGKSSTIILYAIFNNFLYASLDVSFNEMLVANWLHDVDADGIGLSSSVQYVHHPINVRNL